jgi:hypothetical protein
MWGLLVGCDWFRFPEPTRAPGPCGPGGSPCASGQVCFRASALAGTDFCAEACDPSQALPSETEACTELGAKLAVCHPDARDAAAGCPEGFNCYRTSLFDNQGLCIKMPVCSSDADCARLGRSCASALVTQLGQLGPEIASALLHLDHLNCVSTGCGTNASSCPNGEGCLAKQYDISLADVCTPLCNSTPCPPNYTCAEATSGAGSPPLCLPRLPGFRCEGERCIAGPCQDTGAGFKVCTASCADDGTCSYLDDAKDKFYCVEFEGQTERRCVTPRPFHGANCYESSACAAGEFCSHFGPTQKETKRGECRVPCNEDGSCARRGGLPHTCLSDLSGCFPGEEGLPCKSGADCLDQLSCLDLPAVTELELPEMRICTKPCDSAKGCDSDDAYCGAGYCRLRRDDNQSCVRNEQCRSGLCDANVHRCEAFTMIPVGSD